MRLHCHKEATENKNTLDVERKRNGDGDMCMR